MGDVATPMREGFDLTPRPAANIELTRAELALLAKQLREAEKIFSSTRTEVERFVIEMQRLRELRDLFPNVIDDEVFNRARKMFLEGITEDTSELEDQVDEMTKFMQAASERAAANILDAFADFLFDPFEDGVKGMLKGFIDAIRRMIANMLAFQILSGIPGIGAFFTQGRQAGGPVRAGQPVLVGERGPELFIPDASGRVRSNAALRSDDMGGMQFVTNIDARGADPGLIARLPQIMEQRDRRLMLKVQDQFEVLYLNQ